MGQAKLEKTRDILQETAWALHSMSSVLQRWILEGRCDLKGINLQKNPLTLHRHSIRGRQTLIWPIQHTFLYVSAGNELFWEKGAMVDVLEKNIAQTNHYDLRHPCKPSRD